MFYSCLMEPHTIRNHSLKGNIKFCIISNTEENLKSLHLRTMSIGSKLPGALSVYLTFNMSVKSFQQFHVIHKEVNLLFVHSNLVYASWSANVYFLSCLCYTSSVMSDFSLVPFPSLDSPNQLFSASIFLVVLPLKLSILTISRGEIGKNCTLGTSGKNNCIMNGVVIIHKCTCVVTSCFIVFHFAYKELKLLRKEFQKISLCFLIEQMLA